MDSNRDLSIRCPEARALLPDYVEGDLDAALAQRVSDHVLACSDCRHEEALCRQAFGALRAPRNISAPPDLYAGFAAKLAEAERPPFWRLGRLQWVGAAACLTLALLVSVPYLRGPAISSKPTNTAILPTLSSEQVASVMNGRMPAVIAPSMKPQTTDAARPTGKPAQLSKRLAGAGKRARRIVVADARMETGSAMRAEATTSAFNAIGRMNAKRLVANTGITMDAVGNREGADAGMAGDANRPDSRASYRITQPVAPDMVNDNLMGLSSTNTDNAADKRLTPLVMVRESHSDHSLLMLPQVDERVRIGSAEITAYSETGVDSDGRLALVKIDAVTHDANP